jgi:flagellar hook-associated protein 2
MGLSPLAFSGISTYSQDFQTILQRMTTIASFPLEQLKNERADLATKRLITEELNTAVRVFQDALSGLADLADSKSLSAGVSDPGKITVDAVNTNLPATYSITEVSSLATAASETTLLSYANSSSTQVSATGEFRLSVGTQNFNFTLAPSENNLIGLRNRINSLGAGVTATIFTVSPTENYLSISANGVGQRPIALIDDPNGEAENLMTAANPGSNLNFKLNGVAVSRTTNQVNDLIPGVSFTLKSTTSDGEALAISLSSDRSNVANALQSVVDAYNSLQSRVSSQVGAGAGLLSGDLLVREAQNYLRQFASFGRNEGALRSLADFGISFEQTGRASFDRTKFSAIGSDKLDEVFSFFNRATGTGELASRMRGFTDAVNGLAKNAIDQYRNTDTRIGRQIADLTQRISTMRNAYLSKLQAADALLGRLENQQSVVTASIDSLNLVLLGKREK